jgi:pimeloyl-ACP methyl ester carboxylesterase
MLNYTDIGTGPALLIAHGLFGSARNWGVIAKRLSDTRRVISVDMRNHGDSPRFDSNGYVDMAGDLAEIITHLGAPMDVLGHSMGGKTAMTLAVTQPDLVRSLIIGDIAPVNYAHTQMHLVQAMQAIDLGTITRRSDAIAQMNVLGVDSAVQPFLLQSLDVKNKGWKLNLDVLGAQMPAIIGFPDLNGTYGGPTLFLSGAQSDYVLPEHRELIKPLFPHARFAKIPGAGHWLHADKPREFEASARVFLDAVQAKLA